MAKWYEALPYSGKATLASDWDYGDWSKADETYQQGLDLAEEEAAESKLGLVDRSEEAKAAAGEYKKIKEAQRIEQMRREGLPLTVGAANAPMAGRILGRFPPGTPIRVEESEGIPVEKFGQLVQLLRDKEAQIAQQSLHIESLLRSLAGRTASVDENADLLARKDRAWCRQQAVINLMEPIIRKLCGATNDHAEWDACKAALAAYEELGNDQGPAAARPDAVGHAEVRHLADCQNERPQGVAGGEPPRPTEGQDRAAFDKQRYYCFLRDAAYVRRYVGPGDAVPADVELHIAADHRVYWKEYLNPSE